MTPVIHEVVLRSAHHFGSKLPSQATGKVLIELPIAVRQAISMALRGRSTARGPIQGWLKAAADIRFVDHQGKDESILFLEAPRLGDVAGVVYEQGLLWDTRPDKADTGFDLFGDILADVAGRNSDSQRFDPPLLRRLSHFRNVLDGAFQEIHITSRRYAKNDPAKMNAETIQIAERFYSSTPLPRRVRVVGTLDLVRASTQSFAIRLDDGQEVRGVLVAGDIVDVAPWLRKRVLVLGKAIYRASGNLLRIDAESLSPAEEESSLWSSVPPPGNAKLDLSRLRQPQGPRSGVAAIIGKWPGTETDEEIQRALEELS